MATRRRGQQRKRRPALKLFQTRVLVLIVVQATIIAMLLSWTGLIQSLEWTGIDYFFRWRPLEPIESRITVVTIDEADITAIGQWPIPDQLLATALLNLKAQNPKVIGLDLYRNLSVEPGHQQLIEAFKAMPNLIGIQQRFGSQKIPPPPVLANLRQVADAAIPEDADKRVRRAMLTGESEGITDFGLGTALALKYLAAKNIVPVANSANTYQLGKATIVPLLGNEGGYTQIDHRGYQILLDFRGTESAFHTISFRDVLNNNVPRSLIQDRVVLIGSTAESIKDLFLTPYTHDRIGFLGWTPGVFIHANITSQLLSMALDGRPLLQGLPNHLKGVWIFAWAWLGVAVTWGLLQADWLDKRYSYAIAVLLIGLMTLVFICVSYMIFLAHWWVPVAAPLVALYTAVISCLCYHSYRLQRLAYFDGLTQVANRRYFDLHLAKQIQQKDVLTLILCDVDCFKLYNDTYGHQAGDQCLRQVAFAILQACRRIDFVARYGGEEFAIILPRTNADEAELVAAQILQQVRSLGLLHETSKAADHVTLSCGIATVDITYQRLEQADWSGACLILEADKALYRAKQAGRDRFMLANLDDPGT